MAVVNTPVKGTIGYLFKGQIQHVLLLAAMLPGFLYLAMPSLADKQIWGLSGQELAYIFLAVVIVHQVLGWLVFRLQLCFALFSRLFGEHDLAVWGALFFPLFFLRPILTILLGMADPGSLAGPRWLHVSAGVLLLVPVAYTLWSIHAYFGVDRALGGDHFREKYRHMPLVKEGAFRYSSNAMYTFAFLLFWAIGLLFGSTAALAAALFQHAYIWVHYYCTEAPDLDVIYAVGTESR